MGRVASERVVPGRNGELPLHKPLRSAILARNCRVSGECRLTRSEDRGPGVFDGFCVDGGFRTAAPPSGFKDDRRLSY
jgi:hypothetical protein